MAAASTPSLPFSSADLRHWNLLSEFQRHLEPILSAAPTPKTELDPLRTLFTTDYFSLLLFGLLRSLSPEAMPVFGDARVRDKVQELVVIDGALLPALPRMAWA